LTPSESKLVEALVSPKLCNTANAVIIAALGKGMLLLGIYGDRIPTDEVYLLMVKECKEFHGNLTIKELNLAFEMAARNQLEYEVNTYQNFSMLYLNQLLAAYKKWSSGAIKTMPDMENARPDFSHYIYDHHSLDTHRGNIQTGYLHFLNGILPRKQYIPYEWYRVLSDDGFLEYDEDADVKRNARYNDLTVKEKAALAMGQDYVWQLFELAKSYNKNIYERS
jgi:hypothetical protein